MRLHGLQDAFVGGVSIHAHQYWRAMRHGVAHGAGELQVSIHAHQYWRAMRLRQHAQRNRPDVSIHAHQYWRAMLFPAASGLERCRVSIHAHQYWRAMPTSYSDATPDGKFQSTPTNTGGRCLGWAGHAVGSLMFQSTPTNTGGRCTAPPPEPPRIPVSIHAHQYWRAMRANGPCAWEGRHVSIHAHQYWRAMPMRLRFLGLFLLFQSTPTNTGGRCRAVPQRRIRPRCFNPRPPILAGDAYGLIAHDIQRLVSIHAHQYWLAMLAVKRRRYALQQFQSTPTNTGGRCGHEAFPVMLLTMFQSTPTNTGGRCHQLQGKVSLHHVSIHAHQYWRAMRLAHDVAVFHRVVSIHAHQYWRAMPVGNAPVQRGARVSIHAHQYWRAMRRPFLDACATVWFQSTPTNTGGRCRRGRCPR